MTRKRDNGRNSGGKLAARQFKASRLTSQTFVELFRERLRGCAFRKREGRGGDESFMGD